MDQNMLHHSRESRRLWPYNGCSLDKLHECIPRNDVLPCPEPDEVIARVEAVSICSSDVKIVRLGPDHPLFSEKLRETETILGHEVCLRVHSVGRDLAERFRPGQRLGLQPAMRIDGKRQIIGMDLPGGFAQYLVLGLEALENYVFEVPENLPAAAIALLEPYACVERAFRPNCRQDFDADGRVLIVLGEGANAYSTDRSLVWDGVSVVRADAADGSAIPECLDKLDHTEVDWDDLEGHTFQDIVALGEVDRESLSKLPGLMADHGLLLQARQGGLAPIPIDPARVHYNALSFIGTKSFNFTDATQPAAQRFDVRPGGTALVHGAGGAMGRIHVHRLLQLEDGPSTVIATSRKGRRLDDLKTDFEPLARASGRRLIVRTNDELGDVLAEVAPNGLDDAIVVAPDVGAVSTAADALARDGLLSVFAGFPYGGTIDFDLTSVAVTGKRLTGSTGCTVSDMQGVLRRAMEGELNLMTNVRAVAGLDALPEALLQVSRGSVSGKIVIYPQQPDMPLRHLTDEWRKEDEQSLT